MNAKWQSKVEPKREREKEKMKMVVDENMSIVLSEDRYEPCRVCGEQSSGFHCGAVTCEACKVNN